MLFFIVVFDYTFGAFLNKFASPVLMLLSWQQWFYAGLRCFVLCMIGGLITYFIIMKLFVRAVAALLQCVVHTLVLKFCSVCRPFLFQAHTNES